MKLIIASNNANKVREIKQILEGKFEVILSLREAEVSHETLEDGRTFMENALKKAREISAITGCAALADDSGICAHALDGAPGIYSARFAGDYKGRESDDRNNERLLLMLSDKADRTAHYTCAVALVYPDGRELTAEGYMYGSIIDEYRGNNGFGYDPLFVPEGDCRTVAQLSDEEKHAISHRGNALKNLLEKI